MAEGLLTSRLAGKGGMGVGSCGIAALVGKPATDEAIEVMRQHGLNIGAHRARQLDAQVLRDFELVLVMERGQRTWILDEIPLARGRVHLLGRWRGDLEIPDPYRKGMAAFEHAYELIDQCVGDWADRMA